MRIQTDNIDFTANARSIRGAIEYIEKVLRAEVPEDLGDEPSAEEIAAVNSYLSRQRAMREVPLPEAPEENDDMKNLANTIANELERLGNITGDGIDVQQNESGIGLSISEQ